MEIEKGEILVALNEVVAAFSSLDISRWYKCFHTPCMVVNPRDAISVSSLDEMHDVISPTVARLRSVEFDRTVVEDMSVHVLSAATALAEVGFRRLNKSGATIEFLAVLYIFQKSDSRWRIATIALHPAATLFKFEPTL